MKNIGYVMLVGMFSCLVTVVAFAQTAPQRTGPN
jgi:hypothetical protein